MDNWGLKYYTNGSNQSLLSTFNIFRRAIIGNQYVVHVKLATKRLTDGSGGSFHPDVANSVVMLVLPDKEELDKLSREEFDNVPKSE